MKTKITVAALLLAACFSAGAQNAVPPEPAAQGRSPGLHKRGSQTLALTTGLTVPMFVLPAEGTGTLGVGGSFGLSYQYFVADHIALGGVFAGAFCGTTGGRSLFVSPLTARVAYWWGGEPTEFFAGVEAGANLMRLSGNGMITPIVKAGGGVLGKISDSWSIGGQANWWFMPEIHTGAYSDLTRYGNLLEVSVLALYHL